MKSIMPAVFGVTILAFILGYYNGKCDRDSRLAERAIVVAAGLDATVHWVEVYRREYPRVRDLCRAMDTYARYLEEGVKDE